MPTRRVERRISAPAVPRPAHAWARRLQEVGLRTKLVVPIVVLATLPPAVIGVTVAMQMRAALRDRAAREVEFDAASKARNLQGVLDGARDDAALLACFGAIPALAQTDRTTGEGLEEVQRRIGQDLAHFSRIRAAYCGIRCAWPNGTELVRLEVMPAGSTIVTDGEACGCRPPASGHVSVQVQDAANRAGQPPPPHPDVVRFVAAVEGDGPLACVAVSLCADHLLEALGPLPEDREAWLVDATGRYLGCRGTSKARQAECAWERRRNLRQDLGPEEVSAILAPGRDAQQLEFSNSLLSTFTLRVGGDNPTVWTLVITSPRTLIEGPVREVGRSILALLAGTISVATVLGLLVAVYVTRPIVRLRQATQRIISGDMSHPVVVTTGDEIEGLAKDFNTMVGRLRDAQARLRRWNEQIESTLARERESLHALETGLARVDKLTSLGQMTAGVMHEIGNPLAAIKTAIQVCREGPDACPQCGPLLSSIVGEVDRLARFLRSFSRMSRHPDPHMRDVALPEVVAGTVALLQPELRRRGVALVARIDSGVGAILGDPDQLRHLLINLMLNSADAMPRGGEVLVQVLRGEPSGAAVTVSDRGVGIPPELLNRIWEPFFTTKPDGTGLGLPVCRRIAADHSAEIRAEARSGGGTTMTLTLPDVRRPGLPIDEGMRQ